jgi:hypothetical protein
MARAETITLRSPRDADRSAVEQISRSSGFFSEAEVQVALEVFDEAVSTPVSGYEYIVAEDDGEAVGYACWGRETMWAMRPCCSAIAW